MAFRSAGLAASALTAGLLLLAGCAPAVVLPPPITQAEAENLMLQRQLSWWESMFPGQPMPEIEPIEYVDPSEAGTEQMDCLKAANLQGVTFSENGMQWSDPEGTDKVTAAVNLAQFTCQQQYPYDLSDPVSLGMLSEAQSKWVWQYNQTRLLPCLQSLGYTVHNQEADYVEGRSGYWTPYYDMLPMPRGEEWDLIDLHCPPSPVGPAYYRPT